MYDRIEYDPDPWPVYGFEIGRRYMVEAPDGNLFVEVQHVSRGLRVHPAVVVDTAEEARKVWAS